MKPSIFIEVLSQDQPMTPLGRLGGAGYIHHKTGYLPWRVLGSYALVAILEGCGRYQDKAGRMRAIAAGDMLLLSPETAHRYGPGRSGTWSELYVVFEGPAFEFWREAGILDPSDPVIPASGHACWQERLETCIALTDGNAQVASLLALLTEAAAKSPSEEIDAQAPWLIRAKSLLAKDLNLEVSAVQVAEKLGLSYETFRKQFERQVGDSPARFRAGKRLDAARSLLLHTTMTSRQIADSLGYSDEAYFSKRFKQAVGVSPRVFRRETQREEVTS